MAGPTVPGGGGGGEPGGPGGGQSGSEGSVGSTNRGNASSISGFTLRELKVLIRRLTPAPTPHFTGELSVLSIIGSGATFVASGVGFIHWTDTDAYILTNGASSLIIGPNITIPGTLDVTGDVDFGFTAGSIIFQGISGLTQDNPNFFWDDLNNRLGLGTSSPDVDLHLKSTGSINVRLEADSDNSDESDQPTLELWQDGGAVKGVFGFYNSSNDLDVGNRYSVGGVNVIAGGSTRIRIDSDGKVGVGTTAPHSTAHVSGSVATLVTETSGAITLDDTHSIINCTGTAAFTATLPTAVGINGRYYTIKASGTGAITIATTSSQTIDGQTSLILTQYDALKIVSNGSNWLII